MINDDVYSTFTPLQKQALTDATLMHIKDVNTAMQKGIPADNLVTQIYDICSGVLVVRITKWGIEVY